MLLGIDFFNFISKLFSSPHLHTDNLTLQKQLDGAADTSDDDGSDVSDDNLDGDDDDDLDRDDDEEADGEAGAEEEPLNSDDDVSEEEQADLFDTENVVVCQYDKVSLLIAICFPRKSVKSIFSHRSHGQETNGNSTLRMAS